MSKQTSLAEMMGIDAAELGHGMRLQHLPAILGNAMPELPANAVGRHRLVRALRQRFGANFRSLPGIQNLISEFDDHVAHTQRVSQISQIKPQGGRNG